MIRWPRGVSLVAINALHSRDDRKVAHSCQLAYAAPQRINGGSFALKVL